MMLIIISCYLHGSWRNQGSNSSRSKIIFLLLEITHLGGLNKHPVHWVLRLFPRGQRGRGLTLTTQLPLVPTFKNE